MISDLKHFETWNLTLGREDGVDNWPATHLVAGTRTRFIRPDKIVVNLRGGEEEPTSVLVIGQPLADDGRPRNAMKPVVSRHSVSLPGWLEELVEDARTANSVGRGRTGRSD